MNIKVLLLYFLLGGTIVAIVSYFGSQGKGLLAAFIANLPTITIITLCSIYLSSGASAGVSYFKGMLILLPAWLLYAIAIIFLLPRLGLVPSLAIALASYLAAAFVTAKLIQ